MLLFVPKTHILRNKSLPQTKMFNSKQFTGLALVCLVSLTIVLVNPGMVQAGKDKKQKMKALAALVLLIPKKKILIPAPLPLPIPIP